MLRSVAVLAVAVMMVAICIALGEVRISSNFAATQSVPQALSAAFDDVTRPIGDFFGRNSHTGSDFQPPDNERPPQQNALPELRMHHSRTNHVHDRRFHLPG
jgi:hypothetical protein